MTSFLIGWQAAAAAAAMTSGSWKGICWQTFCSFSRDVLALGNRLTKERDEMCKELRRLHESSMELHDNMIMEIQVLREEINSIKRQEDQG